MRTYFSEPDVVIRTNRDGVWITHRSYRRELGNSSGGRDACWDILQWN
ncbi:MAG: hypothetical protein JO031_03665 [Ktedonobacteraceae bacterium]|nr:hypothetical protein [Ktedonobacteraceae bacterium]